MSVYRDNAKPLELGDFVGKNVILYIYHGAKNRWFGRLKGVVPPTDSKPYWSFAFFDNGKDELMFVPQSIAFGIVEKAGTE